MYGSGNLGRLLPVLADCVNLFPLRTMADKTIKLIFKYLALGESGCPERAKRIYFGLCSGTLKAVDFAESGSLCA